MKGRAYGRKNHKKEMEKYDFYAEAGVYLDVL